MYSHVLQLYGQNQALILLDFPKYSQWLFKANKRNMKTKKQIKGGTKIKYTAGSVCPPFYVCVREIQCVQ